MNAIELENVSKAYDNFTLDKISFSVPSGTIMGFVGENGAGKTTTIKAILDLIHIDEGSIRIWGNSSKNLSKDLKAQIGVVFDGSNLHENLTIENINRIMISIYHNWDQKKFYNYLTKFKLPKNKKIKDFSRGMKMKLSIAIALSHNSKLLILDEATSGLDPMVRDEILDLFLEFIQEEDHTIFLSSHIISDIEKIADYVTFIHEGRIVFSENKDELIYSHGIIRCPNEYVPMIDKSYIVGIRQNSFGAEVMIKNADIFKRRYREFSLEKTSIEENHVIYQQGKGGGCMIGLIKKDLLNIYKSIKLIGVLVIFYGFIAFIGNNPQDFSAIFIFIFAMLMLSTYSYDELAQWDRYALTMPLSRDNIVQAKYIMMILIALMGFLVSNISLLVLNRITKADYIFQGIEISAAGSVIIIVFYSIIIPIITKLGVTKARIYFFAIYMVLFMSGSFVFKRIKDKNYIPPKELLDLFELLIKNIYVIIPLLVLLILIISYMISIKIYRKKEF